MRKGVPLTALSSVIEDEDGTERLLEELSQAEQKKFLKQMKKNLETEMKYQQKKYAEE